MDLKLGFRPVGKHYCLEILDLIYLCEKYLMKILSDTENSIDITRKEGFICKETKKKPKSNFILCHCNLGADHVERGYI